jgi:hypothetical protein
MYTTKAVMTSANIKINITLKFCISPFLASSIVPPIADGKPATIPANIIIDIPLPIPLSVICSPSQILDQGLE